MKRILIGFAAFSLAAFLISFLIFLADTVELKWATAAGAIGALAIGLAFNSYLLALRTDTRVSEIQASLGRIRGLQEEIQKELKEQAEQKSSGPPLIASLEAVTKYYMDYMNKQKGEAGSETEKS